MTTFKCVTGDGATISMTELSTGRLSLRGAEGNHSAHVNIAAADRPALALAALGKHDDTRPGGYLDAEQTADQTTVSDEDLLFFAWRSLEGVRIRRERAVAARAERDTGIAALADALRVANVRVGDHTASAATQLFDAGIRVS